VEDLELAGSNYVIPAFTGSFDHIWEQTSADGKEASETLQLRNIKSIAGKLLPPPTFQYFLTDHDAQMVRNSLSKLYLSSLSTEQILH
jgi:hypothetical protein